MSAWTSPSASRGAGAQSVPAFQPETGVDTDAPSSRSPVRATGRKVIALIPAGEVAGRDTVRWHNHDDPVRDQKDNYNSGDMFVYEASLRLLDFDSLEVVPLYSQLTDRDIDRLNDEASVCFLRGSNYLHNKMEWGNLPEVIDKLKLPVVAFGIGAQAPKYGEVAISDRTRRFMDVVSDRSTVIGVRGAFTGLGLALITLHEDAKAAGRRLVDEGKIGILDAVTGDWLILPWHRPEIPVTFGPDHIPVTFT